MEFFTGNLANFTSVTIILFSAYLLLFTWLITRLPFFRKAGLSPQWLAGLFIMKVAVCCLYGYIHSLSEYYPGKIDTWRWYFESLNETGLLKSNPGEFFSSLFHDPYNGSAGDIFGAQNSFWNDLKNNFMIKLMALMNLFSGGRYYINTIFYSVLAFYGPVALYRLFLAIFPGKKAVVFIAAFLLPSVLFWGSGFHKEGLLLSLLAVILYWFYNGLQKGFTVKKISALLLAVALIFILRNYILFALLPAMGCWWLAHKWPGRTAAIYTGGMILFLAVFFMAARLHPKLNLPGTVSQKQREFMELSGHTHVPTDTLRPTAAGFLHNLPKAADMAFLRPRPGEGGLSYLPSALEMLGLLAVFVASLVFRDKSRLYRPIIWFCGCFAIILMLIIGYSVPITGAVIRYRSLALPFLFLLFALPINIERLKKLLEFKNYKKQ